MNMFAHVSMESKVFLTPDSAVKTKESQMTINGRLFHAEDCQ